MWFPFQPKSPDEREDESPFELDRGDVPVRPGAEDLGELEERILRALCDVVDPELGLNIVDLGLVYAVEATDEAVRIAVTSTTPACPMADAIRRDVERRARETAPDALRIEFYRVWEPAWEPELMSADAREELGGAGSGSAAGGLW